MRLIRFALLAAVTMLPCAGRATAATLYTGQGYQNGPLYITLNGVGPTQNAGGSIGLPPNNGSVDGVTTPFLYCVEITTDINVPGTYYADLSSTGIIHGALIPNAGQLAWLIDYIAPNATTSDLQEGLQAAIWQQVYGSNFSVDPVNTSPGIYTAYQAALTALGGNTAPVSDVLWISPYNSNGSPAQAQITAFSHPVPEPSSLVLLGIGLCAYAGLRLRKRRA